MYYSIETIKIRNKTHTTNGVSRIRKILGWH